MSKINQSSASFHYVVEILKTARKTANELTDKIIIDQSQLLLGAIDEFLTATYSAQVVSPALLPALQAFWTEEGSLVLEWIMPNCRLGFSLDPNPAESSWYLITDATLGEIAASGFLQIATLKPLVRWLLTFLALPLQPA